MLIVDDLLLFPVKSFFWLAREIHAAVERAEEEEVETIKHRLSELYMMLETGRISEEAFDEQEDALLERLDALEGDEGDAVDL